MLLRATLHVSRFMFHVSREGVITISDMRMDLQYLIDRLETLVRAARRMPMMSKIMMDEQELGRVHHDVAPLSRSI